MSNSQLLRIATAGSVDDGKSTLIGRLLFDSKAIFEDQLSAVEHTSQSRGHEGPDLALLTDGLRAEREQGITIDVAYRYFATPKRKFIIADTPGHIQYTRNMVTGASTADLALILIDARNGVLEQSRRHAFLATLLGIPHLVLCINKMDLVDYSQERFEEIRDEFRNFATKLEVADLTFVPISALTGDNVVTRSPAMPWYDGPSLLRHLEEVHAASDRNLIDARLPVQYVIRPQQMDFRGYAGTVAGGTFKPGDDVTVLPSGFSTSVSAVWGPGGQKIDEAFAGQAVTMQLADEIDIARGDMIARPHNRPLVSQDVDAMVCWMTAESALKAGSTYTIQHTTRSTRATVRDLEYRLDVNSLHRDESADSLSLNEIGRVRLRTQKPLLFDPYRRNRETGAFILVDESSNNTVAAGMITGASQQEPHIVWHSGAVTREQRGGQGMTLWFTGLSGSGKSSVAVEVERRLVASGPARVRPRRRQSAARAEQEPRFQPGGPQGERPPRRGGRAPARRRRRRRARLARVAVPRGPRRGPRDPRGGRAAVPRDLRRHAARDRRAARSRRGCTRRPAPARSRTSPASPRRTRLRCGRTCCCARPTVTWTRSRPS